MYTIVKACKTPSPADVHIVEQKREQQLDQIRARAYQFFEQRGCTHGNHFEDWTAAEREVLATPPAQVTETADGLQIRVPIPGLSAGDLEVTAQREAVTIEGDSHPRVTNGSSKDAAFATATTHHLFRHITLPHPINPDAVTAKIEVENETDSILVIAAKLAPDPITAMVH